MRATLSLAAPRRESTLTAMDVWTIEVADGPTMSAIG